MRLQVKYDTLYRYSAPTRRLIQQLRVTPHSFSGQNVVDWRVDVDCDARLHQGRDGYGNVTHMLYVDQPVEQLRVSVSGIVLAEDRSGMVSGLPADLPPQVFLRSTPLAEPVGDIADLADSLRDDGPVLPRLHQLNTLINRRMRFDTNATGIGTTAAEAWEARHGVCQDFAHIFIAVAREIGVPARYISGHLFRRDGAAEQEAAHAWAEAHVDGLGWIAFDPANGICADDAYIRVAAGLDYRDAAPFSGARSGGGQEELEVGVEVRLARTQSQFQSQS
jgi:transglutaminase-like putative cysteine protease